MKIIDISNVEKINDFLMIKNNNINIGFSTAETNRSFNRHSKEGQENILSIKKEFGCKSIAYLNQIHSDIVNIYNSDGMKFNENEGDAIITTEKNVIIGVFTADCVPVIIIDGSKEIIATVHSGWKGTYNSISKNVIDKMLKEFNSDINDIKVFIGPHIRRCCYEVSMELKEKFLEKTQIGEEKIFDGRKLSMEACIEKDLIECGISESNIFTLNLCTYCEKNIKLFSYRKSDGAYGRLFSFAYIK